MIRTLGLIGGMSWESTAEYYRHINVASGPAWVDSTPPR
jgi:aspartate/glutamate racemase